MSLFFIAETACIPKGKGWQQVRAATVHWQTGRYKHRESMIVTQE